MRATRSVAVLLLVMQVVYSLPYQQKQSLLDLYVFTNGDSWFRPWNLSTDPCTGEWAGVVCSNNNVIQLSLGSNNLTGSLPDLQLPELTSL